MADAIDSDDVGVAAGDAPDVRGEVVALLDAEADAVCDGEAIDDGRVEALPDGDAGAVRAVDRVGYGSNDGDALGVIDGEPELDAAARERLKRELYYL